MDSGSHNSKPHEPSPLLSELVGHKVVVDMGNRYVCIGTLQRIDDHFLELKNADIHDLRDTQTSRENYVAESVYSGIKRNRKRVLLARADMVAVALLDDVAEQ
jgi:small nuclear ribonucleoprotein (snRNP)-like protein